MIETLNNMTSADVGAAISNMYRTRGPTIAFIMRYIDNNWLYHGQAVVDDIHDEITDYISNLTQKLFPNHELFKDMNILDFVDLSLLRTWDTVYKRLKRPDRHQTSKLLRSHFKHCIDTIENSPAPNGSCITTLGTHCAEFCATLKKVVALAETDQDLQKVSADLR